MLGPSVSRMRTLALFAVSSLAVEIAPALNSTRRSVCGEGMGVGLGEGDGEGDGDGDGSTEGLGLATSEGIKGNRGACCCMTTLEFGDGVLELCFAGSRVIA